MSLRKLFISGIVVGIVVSGLAALPVYKLSQKFDWKIHLPARVEQIFSIKTKRIIERFDSPLELVSGKSFGNGGWLTPELFRGGKIIVDGKNGYAHQISDSYRDSAWIRSTKPLPTRYKISVLLGEVDYGLDKIEGLEQDPEYTEGPQNENGVYFLTITDTEPRGHHNNLWWHQHRKVVIDVDNNVWGSGMPNPVFMVYFNKGNELRSWNGRTWTTDWDKGVTYDPRGWYVVTIERTWNYFILTVSTPSGRQLARTAVPFDEVFSADRWHKDYFVTGEPHENYYAGSVKIKEIKLEY